MKVASLFSGCGGLDLGLRRAGHDIVLQCEIDLHCQTTLKRNFAGTLLCSDVCSLVELPAEIELLTAGFPCIDVSTAGAKAGIYGEQSGLWVHILRLLQTAKDNHTPVPWVLCENVPGILNSYGRETTGVECIATEFERLGYNWAYRIINTAAFGTPVARRRFFFLASLHGDPRDVLLSRGRSSCLGACVAGGEDGDASSLVGRKPCAECYALNPTDPDFVLNLARAHVPIQGMVPTLTASNVQSLCAVLTSQAAIGMLTVESAESLQGFPQGFTALPSKDLSKAASDRLRGAMLGNAVSVETAEWIGNQLTHVYSSKYLQSRGDQPFFDNACQDGYDCSDQDSDDSVLPVTKESFEVSWPNSAWCIKGLGRHCCECSEYPVKIPLESVANVLSCSIDPDCQRKLKRDLRMYVKKLEPLGYQPDRLTESINQCGVGNVRVIQEKGEAFIKVGELVWAKLKSYPWWPAEVLNLDQYAITDLPSLIPARLLQSYMKYCERISHTKHVGGRKKRDLCLVSFFGDETFAWIDRGNLVSFEANRERMMDNLLVSNQLHNWKLSAAIEEADSASQLKKLQENQSDDLKDLVDSSFIISRYSHKSRAAYLASMAEKEAKCKMCATCLKAFKYEGLKPRKCLRNRAWAAAAAGHQGAQLAILGNRAIGAKVKIFWQDMQEWFEGIITGFDALQMQHTVSYIDGDTEHICLWSAKQEVTISELGSQGLECNEQVNEQEQEAVHEQGVVVAPSTPMQKSSEETERIEQEVGQSSNGVQRVSTDTQGLSAKRRKRCPTRLGWAEDSELFFSGGSGLQTSSMKKQDNMVWHNRKPRSYKGVQLK